MWHIKLEKDILKHHSNGEFGNLSGNYIHYKVVQYFEWNMALGLNILTVFDSAVTILEIFQ